MRSSAIPTAGRASGGSNRQAIGDSIVESLGPAATARYPVGRSFDYYTYMNIKAFRRLKNNKNTL
ncbi:unnamed protein product, partial [Nesidiocoris tenuis]